MCLDCFDEQWFSVFDVFQIMWGVIVYEVFVVVVVVNYYLFISSEKVLMFVVVGFGDLLFRFYCSQFFQNFCRKMEEEFYCLLFVDDDVGIGDVVQLFKFFLKVCNGGFGQFCQVIELFLFVIVEVDYVVLGQVDVDCFWLVDSVFEKFFQFVVINIEFILVF